MENWMQCPVDGETLVMADRGGVEIDYCPKCRGVWLDRGELDKIIERAVGQDAGSRDQGRADQGRAEPSRIAPSYQQEPPRAAYREEPRRYSDDDRDRPHKKRRESFLSELFDF
jgi:Zn-finger nucleic acid-binding protein